MIRPVTIEADDLTDVLRVAERAVETLRDRWALDRCYWALGLTETVEAET